MGWQTRLLRLLGGRGQARTTLVVSGHDASEQVAWTMANGRWLGLRGVVLRILARPAARLDFTLQTLNLVFVSAASC
jgi:hypothetical protein